MPYNVIPADIEDLFQGLQIDRVKMVRDRETDKFKGYAYVDFKDKESLDKAIAKSGSVIFDREVRISLPQRRKDGGNRTNNYSNNRNSSYGGGEQRNDYRRSNDGGYNNSGYEQRRENPLPDQAPFTAYVGNLDYSVTEEDLSKIFDGLAIDEVRVIRDRATNQSKGHGYVDFKDKESLENALTVNNQEYQGRNLRVDVANQKKPSYGNSFREGNSRQDNSNSTPFVMPSGPWRKSAGGELASSKPKLKSPDISKEDSVPQENTASTASKEDPFGGAKPVEKQPEN